MYNTIRDVDKKKVNGREHFHVTVSLTGKVIVIEDEVKANKLADDMEKYLQSLLDKKIPEGIPKEEKQKKPVYLRPKFRQCEGETAEGERCARTKGLDDNGYCYQHR